MEERSGSETALTTYGCPLAPISSFKYLGRILLASDDAWPELVCNFRQACKKWVNMTWLLGREVSDYWTLGMFYVAVVQEVLFHGSETWVMSPHIGRTLVSFHHRVAHRLTRRKTRRDLDGNWVYTPLLEAMA